MTAQAHVSARPVSRRDRWSSERLFYTGFAVAIAAAVVLGLIASQPLRFMLMGTHAWLAFAGWAVSLLPG